MSTFGSNLILALDNFFGWDVTAEDVLRIVNENAGYSKSSTTLWETLWAALEPMAVLRADPISDLEDAFSIHAHWMEFVTPLAEWPASEFSRYGGSQIDELNLCVNAMKSYLLYYPRVLIGYFPFLPDAFTSEEDLYPEFFIPRFLKAFAPMLALRKLVQKDVIHISPRVDPSSTPATGLAINKGVKRLAPAMKAAHLFDRHELLGLLGEYGWGITERISHEGSRRESVRTDTLIKLLAKYFLGELYSIELFGANYVADTDNFWKLLNLYHQNISEHAPHAQQTDLRLARLLTEVHLPNLGSLNPRDIVELRLNDDAFQEWRVSIRRVLRHFASMPSLPESFSDEFQEIASELLLPSARRLEESIKHRRSLSAVLKATATRFSLSVLASGVAGELLHSVAPVVGATATNAILALWEISHTHVNSAEHVLLRHYSLLTSPKEDETNHSEAAAFAVHFQLSPPREIPEENFAPAKGLTWWDLK